MLTDVVVVLIACVVVVVVFTPGVAAEVFVDILDKLLVLETLDALDELVIF